MAGASNQLMKAIHSALSEDEALTVLLDGAAISDRLSEKPKLPAVIYGELEVRDYSTGSEAGEEHFLALEIYSDGPSRKSALTIAAKLRAVLSEGTLDIGPDFALVSLFWISTKVTREKRQAHEVTRLKFRAVTETIAD